MGSKQLFNVIGTGFFGDVFEILMVLPEILVVLISGLTKSKEVAQLRVSVAVCWNHGVLPHTDVVNMLKTDKETSVTAGIMLISLIPFLILQLSDITSTSSGDRKVILIALVVSVSGLLAYFIYQIFHPWIQERSLEYMKYKNLRTGFLQHMERHATGKLVTNERTPNIPVFKRLFAKVDKDGDGRCEFPNWKLFFLEMNSGKVQVKKEYAVTEVLKAFDVNHDETITEDEFTEGCKNHGLRRDGPNFDKIEHLMSRILKHVQNNALKMLTDEGRPNVDCIKSLFEQVDTNNNKYISQSELKEVIQNIKFGKA
ncbi:hypothetical protein Acr_15g0016050 [Actinidia rufa]|uniref:EF-hand domain-containing protein n=1 Tax=Actinidia rufa TaxID=165716 RepID=A0A7J0FX05_9ERIC|nr:hypothetical protein Acr_15g0016050 [Actinidia rufa]